MKHVIIDTGRVYGYGGYKMVRRKKIRSVDYDEDAFNFTKEGMRFPYSCGLSSKKGMADRLTPLYRFLENNCGRKWDDVWKEICESCSNRSIRGFHLREHVKRYVNYRIINGKRAFYRSSFYTDEEGILLECPDIDYYGNLRCKNRKKPEKDPVTSYALNRDRLYLSYIGTNWFLVEYEEIEHMWVEKSKLAIKTKYAEEIIRSV